MTQHNSVENASNVSFIGKKVLLTCSILLQNKWWGINLGNNAINWLWTCIFKQPDLTLNLFSRWRMCIFFYHLLIPNPIHGQWMDVSIILYFVKCDQIELEADWILCISGRLYLFIFSRSGALVLNPWVSSGHITKPTQFGSKAGRLCSYETQNLMSMNNEYYSTCWWQNRLPVIRSMKALFSREHCLTESLDSHNTWILHRNFLNSVNCQIMTKTSHHILYEIF